MHTRPRAQSLCPNAPGSTSLAADHAAAVMLCLLGLLGSVSLPRATVAHLRRAQCAPGEAGQYRCKQRPPARGARHGTTRGGGSG